MGVRLDVVKSERETLLSTRSYTITQVARIASAQSKRDGLATQIAHNAGLRAHELLTIRPANERQAATHREWSADRFAGREGERYTVEGKGGLVREVLLSRELAAQLEATRLAEPRQVTDRGVNYTRYYLNSRQNYTYAMPGSWISKALRISRCALVTSVRI